MKIKLRSLIVMLSKFITYGLLTQIFTLGMLLAHDSDAQKYESVRDLSLDLNLRGVTLEQAFQAIERETEYEFSYDRKILNHKLRVDLVGEDRKVYDYLMELSRNAALHFKQINNFISVSKMENGNEDAQRVDIVRQTIAVTGRATSAEDGEGLPGVNVIIKGTAQGTVTDLDGRYNIDVPDVNTVLVFSSVGYVQREITVGNNSVIDLALTPDVTALEEIVVVGYGSKKKGELTSSVSTVSGDKVQKPTVQRIDQALQGQAAGVQVVNSSGRPGAPAVIRVRGSSTINNNSPLYVIDGVQTDNIENINPADIESINILKDAGGSIYGAQAANGVIIITTKSGKSGEPRLTVDLNYGFQKVTKIPDFMNTEQFTRTYNAARAADGLSLYWDLNNLPPHDTKWVEQLFGTAPISNNNVSLSGGNDNTNYLLGINYMNQQGVVKTSGFERYNLRFNSDSRIGKKIRIGNTMTIGQESIKVPGVGEARNELFVTALRAAPTIPVRWTEWDAQNNPLFASRGWQVGDYAGPSRAGEHPGSKNVVGYIEEGTYNTKNNNFRLFGTLYGEYEPVKNLVFRTQFGGDVGHNKSRRFDHTFQFGNSINARARLIENATSNQNYQWDNTLRYDINLRDTHNISALIGMNARRNYSEFMQVHMRDFVDEDLSTISSGTTIWAVDGSNMEDTWISYFGRLNYNYQGKYYIQGIFRADGSSKFGTNNRFGYFPSVSGAWRLSQESFWNSSVISEVKVRGSWGMTGNDRIPAFGYLENLDFNGYVFGQNQQFAQGVYPMTIANPDLKWETVVLTDFGLDLGILGNKFTITADWFNKETRDMLLQKPITASSGYSSKPWYNAGSMKTTGWDFELGYNDSFGDWAVNISTNMSTYKNEVLELGADNEIIDMPLKTEVGEPINYFFGYETDGLFQSQEDIDNHAFQTAGTSPGDIRYKDQNNDGVIDILDRTQIGNPFPDMIFGLNATVTYLGFDLSILASAVVGNEIYREPVWGGFEGAVNRYNGFAWVADYWSPDNLHNDVLRPRATFNDRNNNNRESDRFVSDGSYLRLNNVQFGYTLNKSIVEKIGFVNIRFYFSGQNLLTLTDYLAFDPEVGGENYLDKFGVDMYTTYPPARIITFGVNFVL